MSDKKKYQFVNWFPDWKGCGFKKSVYGMTLIYDWYLWLGFWEIRKWHDLKDGDIERYNKESEQCLNPKKKNPKTA